MKLQRRRSGLVVPKPPPKPPPRRYGLLEIESEERREMATRALLLLWDALDLSNQGPSAELPESKGPLHWAAYHFIGDMLLGEECPTGEVFT